MNSDVDTSRLWHRRKGDLYSVITGRIVGTLENWQTHREEESEPHASHAITISRGFTVCDSDDFNIGVWRNGRLVALLWMDELVDDNPALMAEIQEQVRP